MKQWFVAQTQPLKETLAQQHLNKQGFETYLPKFEKTRRHARKEDTVQVPLFPRYIFIHFDPEKEQWRKINGTRGISYLLTNNERPAHMPPHIIEELKDQESQNGLLDLSSLHIFAKGDDVFIKEGAFEGMKGTFESISDKQRVEVLLNFLGRETKIKIPLYMIEEIS